MNTTFDETDHPRESSGRFATKAASEPDVDLSDRLTPPGTYTGKPLMVTIQPQAWVNDYAVDAGNPVKVDVAPYLHNADRWSRDEFVADASEGRALSVHDHLYGDAVLAGEAPEGFGPYSITVADPDQVAEWMQDNPPWTPDGVTPHPTGGYVAVEETRHHNRYVQRFLDADGELHRDDGPASHERDDTGARLHYCRHGKPHNERGPALVEHGPNHTHQVWFVDGEEVAEETKGAVVHDGWQIVKGRPVRLGQ